MNRTETLSFYKNLSSFLKNNNYSYEKVSEIIKTSDENYMPLEHIDRKFFDLLADFCNNNNADYIEDCRLTPIHLFMMYPTEDVANLSVFYDEVDDEYILVEESEIYTESDSISSDEYTFLLS